MFICSAVPEYGGGLVCLVNGDRGGVLPVADQTKRSQAAPANFIHQHTNKAERGLVAAHLDLGCIEP